MAGLGCIKRPHKWLKAKGKWLKVEGIFFAFPLALSLLPLAGFLLFQLPQPLRQGRDDLEQVADDAVGGHLEDRRFLIPVDGDDHVRVLHPDQVLDRPAYPAGDIYLGADGLAGLPHLPLRGHPAGIYRAPRRADHTAKLVGQFLEHGEVVLPHHPPAAADDELGAGDIDLVFPLFVAHHFQDLDQDVLFGYRTALPDDLAASPHSPLGHGHDVGADGGHLGTEMVAHDGGHDVAAEGGAGLHQVSLVVDAEPGAVRGEAGLEDGGDRPRQVAAESGGPHQDDLRLVLLHQVADRLQVALGPVMAKDRGVDQVGLFGAVLERLAAEVLDVVADHHGGQLDAEIAGQVSPGPEELPGNRGSLPLGLLDEHPDAAVGGQLLPEPRLLLVHLFNNSGGLPLLFLLLLEGGEDLFLLDGEEHLKGAGGADLDALGAADALGKVDDRLARLVHLDGVHRAGALAAGTAGNAAVVDEARLAERLFDRFFWFGHVFSFVGATHASPEDCRDSKRARHALPLHSNLITRPANPWRAAYLSTDWRSRPGRSPRRR